MESLKNGKWKMENGKWKMENQKSKMENDNFLAKCLKKILQKT